MPAKRKDLVLVHGRTSDGAGLNVLRAREEHIEAGTIRPLEEGRPLHGEIVKLTPRPELPVLFDAETELDARPAGAAPLAPPGAHPEARATTDGPPQVASDSYRKNWDAIWKRPAKRLPN